MVYYCCLNSMRNSKTPNESLKEYSSLLSLWLNIVICITTRLPGMPHGSETRPSELPPQRSAS